MELIDKTSRSGRYNLELSVKEMELPFHSARYAARVTRIWDNKLNCDVTPDFGGRCTEHHGHQQNDAVDGAVSEFERLVEIPTDQD